MSWMVGELGIATQASELNLRGQITLANVCPKLKPFIASGLSILNCMGSIKNKTLIPSCFAFFFLCKTISYCGSPGELTG